MQAETKQLLDLFEAERLALRHGRFEDLGKLGQEKARLATLCGSVITNRDALAEIARRLARNQRLLSAAIAGFSEGTDRVTQIRRASAGFSAYGADGRRDLIAGSDRPEFEKRA